MGDFFQNGMINTLHRLGDLNLKQLERRLKKHSKKRPVALVLPALYSDLKSPAMAGILAILKEVNYIRQIVLALAKANEDEFEDACRTVSSLPQKVSVIYNDGERMQRLYKLLDEKGLSAGQDGKGRSAWLSYGYVLAKEECDVIALHDCDVVSYGREFLARLLFPVVHPNLNFEFCKGYYSRVTDRMHGRVTRLFVTPLIRSLERIFGHLPFLVYLDSFRYPLAGEFSMISDLARVNRIPGDWGLEVGVLAEVYRNCSVNRICQVDLCDSYEHKHQGLSPEDASTGLLKMSIDICKSLFRTLSSQGVYISQGHFRTLKTAYVREAEEFIAKYSNDAIINDLKFDRHEEATAVEAFAKGISVAAQAYLENPIGAPLIPNWNRVAAAIPGFLDLLAESVELDNEKDYS